VILGTHNRSGNPVKITVSDSYSHRKVEFKMEPEQERSEFWALEKSYGWYDFRIATSADSSFRHRLAGHLETGRDSITDPALGTVHSLEETSLNQKATSSVEV
jgi:phospholipase C